MSEKNQEITNAYSASFWFFLVPLVAGLWLVAAGCAIDYGAYRLFEEDFGSPIVMLVAGLSVPFWVGGVWMLWNARNIVRDNRTRRRLLERYAGELWKVRPHWRDGRIGAIDNGGLPWALIIFVIIFNAISLIPLVGVLGSSATEFPWLILVLPAIGLVLALGLIQHIRRKRRYGDSIFQQETLPAYLGHRLSGYVHTGVPAGSQAAQFDVKLCCARLAPATGIKSSSPDKILWEKHQRIRGFGKARSDGTRCLDVPVEFELPDDQLPATPFPDDKRVVWRLEIVAELPSVNYIARFELPVVAPEAATA